MGNRPLKKKEPLASPESLHCMCCNNELRIKDFYASDSDLYASVGKIPYCKDCVEKLYLKYLEEYRKLEYANPDRKAVERICMAFDLYYSDEIFDSALNYTEEQEGKYTPLIYMYIRFVKMYQHRNKKGYGTTIQERYKASKGNEPALSIYDESDSDTGNKLKKAKKIFGKSGFSNDEYIELCEQYEDWTSRHECNTKAQEEVFKNICLTQLQLSKAIKAGDTNESKDLSLQLQRWLDTGKLQPKQNAGETVADNQTLGTLIDKWENTRPIPEIEEELRDVDKIGLYIDVFFRGHTAKSVGLRNAMSNLYDRFMEPYTVRKPEYVEDDGNESLFDAVFGNASLEDDIYDPDQDDEGVV